MADPPPPGPGRTTYLSGPPRAQAATVRRIVGKIVYWLAVLVISLALLVGLVLFFESRDESTLDTGAAEALALGSLHVL